MRLFFPLLFVVLTYLYAAAFSSSVSLTITATAWYSIWTYAALLGGMLAASITVWAGLAVFGLVIVAIVTLAGLVYGLMARR